MLRHGIASLRNGTTCEIQNVARRGRKARTKQLASACARSSFSFEIRKGDFVLREGVAPTKNVRFDTSLMDTRPPYPASVSRLPPNAALGCKIATFVPLSSTNASPSQHKNTRIWVCCCELWTNTKQNRQSRNRSIGREDSRQQAVQRVSQRFRSLLRVPAPPLRARVCPVSQCEVTLQVALLDRDLKRATRATH